jgi:hypothetical protein
LILKINLKNIYFNIFLNKKHILTRKSQKLVMLQCDILAVAVRAERAVEIVVEITGEVQRVKGKFV